MKNITRRIDLPMVMTVISALALVVLVVFMVLALFSLIQRDRIGDAIIIGGCIIMSAVMVYYLFRAFYDYFR